MSAVGLVSLEALLGGCSFPNSSNPTLSITSATIAADSATLEIVVQNPSDYDLHLHQITWELTHGPLPVASGEWTTHTDIPKGGTFATTQTVVFEVPSVDPSADTLELSGLMGLGEPGSATGETEFGTSAFRVSAPVQR